ncbi:hypothetical protein [Haloferula sp. BvORR071]|uniref:hypothetical protein n=1 Tax=Haloferula sp. BvORR071 TaxID=1396141 RepID=UPI002240F0C1|nr:hypothetical protein [Haloferula sp. BvORR071]
MPIRLLHHAPALFEELTRLGMLCVRGKNLTAELVAIADPGEAVLKGSDRLLFPGLGLSLLPSRLAGLHALRLARLPQHVGMLEFDFEKGSFPLSIAVPDEFSAGSRLKSFVAAFCAEEVTVEELFAWRAEFTPAFEACPCCQSIADQRRACPERHPLAPILADLAELRLSAHCRLIGSGFDFSRFITTRALSFDEGTITANDDGGDCVLRIDPAFAHAIWVLPVQVDGECRTTVRVYDTLGSLNLELSVPGDQFVAPWQSYCAQACSQ